MAGALHRPTRPGSVRKSHPCSRETQGKQRNRSILGEAYFWDILRSQCSIGTTLVQFQEGFLYCLYSRCVALLITARVSFRSLRDDESAAFTGTICQIVFLWLDEQCLGSGHLLNRTQAVSFGRVQNALVKSPYSKHGKCWLKMNTVRP